MSAFLVSSATMTRAGACLLALVLPCPVQAQPVNPAIQSLAYAAQRDCEQIASGIIRRLDPAKVGPNMRAEVKAEYRGKCLALSLHLIELIEDGISTGKVTVRQVEGCHRRVQSGEYTMGEGYLASGVFTCLSPAIHGSLR